MYVMPAFRKPAIQTIMVCTFLAVDLTAPTLQRLLPAVQMDCWCSALPSYRVFVPLSSFFVVLQTYLLVLLRYASAVVAISATLIRSSLQLTVC